LDDAVLLVQRVDDECSGLGRDDKSVLISQIPTLHGEKRIELRTNDQHISGPNGPIREVQPLNAGVENDVKVDEHLALAVEHLLRIDAFSHPVILVRD
jgi:hypothetical protein